MNTFIFRPADPDRDFGRLAAWFSLIEDAPTSERGLQEYYAGAKDRVIQRVAQDEHGELRGFFWVGRDRTLPERVYCSLYVEPAARRQGLGSRLYTELEQAAAEMLAHELRFDVWDNDPESNAFAGRRGYRERGHRTAWDLDLAAFDDRAYEPLIARLQAEGFCFTSMEALGNTDAAQRRLFALNNATAIDIPGGEGEPAWASFEDFQARVCAADWYKPGGQMVVIDLATDGADGPFVALSAITRFAGADHAYNLHTGVDRRYRGRKLAQAVKVIALRYARDVLGVAAVHTHHTAVNAPMIAIDRKLGYVQAPGMYALAKNIGEG